MLKKKNNQTEAPMLYENAVRQIFNLVLEKFRKDQPFLHLVYLGVTSNEEIKLIGADTRCHQDEECAQEDFKKLIQWLNPRFVIHVINGSTDNLELNFILESDVGAWMYKFPIVEISGKRTVVERGPMITHLINHEYSQFILRDNKFVQLTSSLH